MFSAQILLLLAANRGQVARKHVETVLGPDGTDAGLSVLEAADLVEQAAGTIRFTPVEVRLPLGEIHLAS